MGFNATGVYTPAAGALTAAPGGIIKSSVWNAIFTDMTAAFTQVAQSKFLLNTLTAAGSATLVDTTSLTATFNDYFIIYDNVVPVTNATQLALRVSQNGGSSYLATGYLDASTATTEIRLTGTSSIDNTAGTGVSGQIYLRNVNDSTNFKMVSGTSVVRATGAASAQLVAGWFNTNANTINALQFLMLSGNISTGKIYIYGIK